MSQEEESNRGGDPDRGLLRHRKRIVAREVRNAAASQLSPEDLTASNGVGPAAHSAGARQVSPEEARAYAAVFDPPPPPPPGLGEFMLDPTSMGDRHRVHSHNRVYRITILAMLISWMGIAACVVLMRFDHLLRARATSAATIIVALAALRLSRSNPLCRRLMGYAIVGAVVACITSALCLTTTLAPRPSGMPEKTPSHVVHGAEGI